ncbi:hypothetical protein [Clostridium butyricum]|jgi:hypothetical protein
MIHHHLTTYVENGVKYAESWIQINIFKWCFCIFKRKKKLYTVMNRPR